MDLQLTIEAYHIEKLNEYIESLKTFKFDQVNPKQQDLDWIKEH